ncbi:expressed unknown protein [Seminavis robusta]|uniref:Uncharacterized protein n=1 Tax=Seminavis robusta TaxID=568900 RepID=A0A9N8D972_9STRA|nr:expressed unknown protein [Seminavis robusta]|eukprot:Sro48_g028070.1 n/a (431) ;mRNA; r:9139-10431
MPRRPRQIKSSLQVHQKVDSSNYNKGSFRYKHLVSLLLAIGICVFIYRDTAASIVDYSNINLLASSSSTSTLIKTDRANTTVTSSKDATVMGMATNYDVHSYKRFVGSLRAVGFLGHIILIVSQDPKPGVEEYLKSQKVTTYPLIKVACTHGVDGDNTINNANSGNPTNEHDVERRTCAHPYPHLKARWARFALQRDYLTECTECTGPVLIADVRDTFFQRDPFGPDAPPVTGLQLFEETKRQRTTHWLTQQPIEHCTGQKIFNEVMLCSGTTVGTREAMLHYLQTMVDEMTQWMKKPQCCCSPLSGDDQAIHNYLHYGLHKFPADTTTVVPNGHGLVYTVGVQADLIHVAKREHKKALNMTIRQALEHPYTTHEQHNQGNWLPPEFEMTDEQGYFRNADWQRSFIIHQYDRFGQQVEEWLFQHGPCKNC